MLSVICLTLGILGINAQTSTTTTSTTVATTVDPATAEMETCVIAADVVGPTVTLSRNVDAGYMEITMVGPDDRWFAFGFGNKFMADTYAVVSVGAGNTQERILGEKEYDDNGMPIAAIAAGTLLGSNSWASTGNPTVTVEDGNRVVKFRRPFAFGQTYDFTKFMIASQKSLDIISAMGMENSAGSFTMHNIQNPDAPSNKERDGATIGTICSFDDGSTPSPIDPGVNSPSKGYMNNGYVVGLFMAFIVAMF